MAVPDYQSIMLPLLSYLSDNRVHALRDVVEGLATQFKLTEEERREMLERYAGRVRQPRRMGTYVSQEGRSGRFTQTRDDADNASWLGDTEAKTGTHRRRLPQTLPGIRGVPDHEAG